MIQPELYRDFSGMPKTETKFVLDNYFHLIKFRPDGKDRILDIGSGDGELSMDILLKRFPNKEETLLGLDVSKEMLKYATENYGKNGRVSFRFFDIESPIVPDDLIGTFDHVFSIYVLQYAQNQKYVIIN